jgi:hypothetical protein
MIKDAWDKYKDKNGVTPLDLLNLTPDLIDQDGLNNRMSICEGCPRFFKLTKQCLDCGCHMPSKAKFQLAKCPLKKW